MTQHLTIPSRALEVWRRLYTRYSLEPFPASIGPDVSKTIQPVTQADLLLMTPEVRFNEFESVGSSDVIAVTVPDGERWRLHTVQIIRLGGDKDVSSVSIFDGITAMRVVKLVNETDVVEQFQNSFVMEPGWQVRVRYTAAGTIEGTWRFNGYVEVEDLF